MISLFRIGRALCRGYFRFFYHHRAYLPQEIYRGGAIIASNHTSFYDPPLVGISWPEDVHFLARDTLFKVWGLSWIIRRTNTHPVSQSGLDLKLLKEVCAHLQQGEKWVIFPEGTRSETGELEEIKLGVSLIATKANVPVIPAYIHGAYEIWNRDRSFPKLWGRTVCVFGSPIFPSEFAHLDRKQAQQALADKLRDKILALKAWYLNGAIGFPS